MKITYDKEADALYIRLVEGEHQCRVVRLTDDIALDFGEQAKQAGLMNGVHQTFRRREHAVVTKTDHP